MNYKILATVSALAIMSLSPMAMAAENVKGALAAETQTDLKRMQPDPDQVLTEKEAERAWSNTKEKVSNAVDETKEKVSNAADNVEYTLFGNGQKGVDTTITASATATGLLNKPVHNATNERVGTLRDIIVDSSGKASLAVVSDTSIPGIGKEAAFDYTMVMRQNANGDVFMPLTEEAIKNARSFSYDQQDNRENAEVRTIPAGGYSVDKLMSANVVDAQGKKVASVDNITFRNGKADALVIGYDKTLGMGGKKAALTFSNVKLNAKGDGAAEFQLTAAQAAQLESMKERASN